MQAGRPINKNVAWRENMTICKAVKRKSFDVAAHTDPGFSLIFLPISPPPRSHTHAHTHTCTHMYTHVLSCMHMYTHIRTHARTHVAIGVHQIYQLLIWVDTSRLLASHNYNTPTAGRRGATLSATYLGGHLTFTSITQLQHTNSR